MIKPSAKRKEITISTVQGIGDLIWVYQKLSPYFDCINWNILKTSESPIEVRAKEFLKDLLPKTGEVTFEMVSIQKYNRVVGGIYYVKDIMEGYKRGERSFEYACNKHLEQGVRLEDIDPEFPPILNLDLPEEFIHLPFTHYIACYISANTHQGGNDVWMVRQWWWLLNLFRRSFPETPILFIGAEYDRKVLEELTQIINQETWYPHHLVIGASPKQVVYMIRNASAFIGYQSGLNVIADLCDTKQMMLYFKKLGKMVNAWAKKENIKNKIYNPYLFNQLPDDVYKNFPYRVPVAKPKHILLTAGIGDFIVIDSLMTEQERRQVHSVYWATRQEETIKEILPLCFPNVRYHWTVNNQWGEPDSPTFSAANKEHLFGGDFKKLLLDMNPNTVEDYSINVIFKELEMGRRQYHGSSLLSKTLADISKFNLPPKYIVIHPYSENARKEFRDLSRKEWELINTMLNMGAVVINKGTENFPVTNKKIIDLSNKTTLLEALEITKNACGYIGCSSCFSVLAAQSTEPQAVMIKGSVGLKDYWSQFYYGFKGLVHTEINHNALAQMLQYCRALP